MTTRLTDGELYDAVGELRSWVDEGQTLIKKLTGELLERQPGIEMEARLVPDGCFFRKRTGSVQYLRISDSAASFYMKDTSLVYGIEGYGNMTGVKPETKVIAIQPPNWKQDEWWRDLMTELGLFDEDAEDEK
jgi:hypothetical protein